MKPELTRREFLALFVPSRTNLRRGLIGLGVALLGGLVFQVARGLDWPAALQNLGFVALLVGGSIVALVLLGLLARGAATIFERLPYWPRRIARLLGSWVVPLAYAALGAWIYQRWQQGGSLVELWIALALALWFQVDRLLEERREQLRARAVDPASPPT